MAKVSMNCRRTLQSSSGGAQPPLLPGTINAQGGVPIKVGDQLIGAIAVSGAPGGDKDEVCVQAGLDKIASRLK